MSIHKTAQCEAYQGLAYPPAIQKYWSTPYMTKSAGAQRFRRVGTGLF